ncbi:hypothetical protein KVM00_01680 [Helicobacter pylori]|nr:hypothetical protein KVM00_01680 [Helicobacter pylori]
MAENSFKNVSTHPKAFFLLPIKTLFLLGGVFSAFFIMIAGLVLLVTPTQWTMRFLT